ncbi:hypothetical protein LCI18_002252 [Fusarium solani-melongenae]|uniref:Uncharacterized protein n=1 Tax=Fusarium solani subsp. cucurbitae TaxID=2747967 RepID=A0ACD3YQR5_FUSSC|nr:hypothetical protein LCI18_002252 [Fusarium solani-melongenae]
MSSVPPPNHFASASASAAEKNASSAVPARTAKLRSCVVCRSRKVRCDKLSPCSNCRRAGIPCVIPSNDRPPRWARRLERVADGSVQEGAYVAEPADEQVMERLRNLEDLVKELRGQLEQASAGASPAGSGSAQGNSPSECRRDASSPSTSTTSDVQKYFGRMVLQDGSRARYVASGFWSRISDELDGLKMDTRGLPSDGDESSDDDLPSTAPSTRELERAPSERHAFLFRHNLTGIAPEVADLRPLPSQIPFLLDIFSENVNIVSRIVHMPAIRKMIRETRSSGTSLSPANEALMFSIYYAAVTSMEEDDVMTNFGSTKAELNLKYRLGLEHALAKADFLNDPNIVLVQAFAIFLLLVRRHDSPRYVWMMTGLLIRMAHALGLHRDGSRFPHLTPFEVEQRRRLWWMIGVIDVRASEDQGTEFTISRDSFDTKMPLNINDEDLDPDTKEMPPAREILTDMSFVLAMLELSDVSKKIMASTIDGVGLGPDEQTRLLDEVCDKVENGYFQFSVERGEILHWVGLTCLRLMRSKLILLIYLPTLFASPDERFSEEVRDKLLVAAIEVAEYNHALNSEQKCRQWRWVYQTYTHWYAIVYLMVEICRRKWSPVIERAWVDLHSSWLIPSQHNMSKHSRVWVPLRKLMAKARGQREMELAEIRANGVPIESLERRDSQVPAPASSGPFSTGNGEENFLEYWRKLVTGSVDPSRQPLVPLAGGSGFEASSVPQGIDALHDTPQHSNHDIWQSSNIGAVSAGGHPIGPVGLNLSSNMEFQSEIGGQSTVGVDLPWMWTTTDGNSTSLADMDVAMEVDDVNWNSWLQSAVGMELNLNQMEPA